MVIAIQKFCLPFITDYELKEMEHDIGQIALLMKMENTIRLRNSLHIKKKPSNHVASDSNCLQSRSRATENVTNIHSNKVSDVMGPEDQHSSVDDVFHRAALLSTENNDPLDDKSSKSTHAKSASSVYAKSAPRPSLSMSSQATDAVSLCVVSPTINTDGDQEIVTSTQSSNNEEYVLEPNAERDLVMKRIIKQDSSSSSDHIPNANIAMNSSIGKSKLFNTNSAYEHSALVSSRKDNCSNKGIHGHSQVSYGNGSSKSQTTVSQSLMSSSAQNSTTSLSTLNCLSKPNEISRQHGRKLSSCASSSVQSSSSNNLASEFEFHSTLKGSDENAESLDLRLSSKVTVRGGQTIKKKPVGVVNQKNIHEDIVEEDAYSLHPALQELARTSQKANELKSNLQARRKLRQTMGSTMGST
jgi:hypothetical protein